MTDESNYYERFQRAVARSVNAAFVAEDEALFFADFLQKEPEPLFLEPLVKAKEMLTQRLEEFFRVDTGAAGHSGLDSAAYARAKEAGAQLSRAQVLNAMRLRPLSLAVMLHFLFEQSNQDLKAPCVVTLGTIYQDGKPLGPLVEPAAVKTFAQTGEPKLELSAWLTFVDGVILDPISLLRQTEGEPTELLRVSSALNKNDLVYDPLFIGTQLGSHFGAI